MKEYFSEIQRFNFWNDSQPDLGFERKYYLDKLLKFTHTKLIKVLVGQRRVGKSFILRQVASKLIKEGVDPKNILYINKEYLEFDFIQSFKDLEQLVAHYKKELQPKGKVWIFIDEIQNITEWERFVNSYAQDFTREYELFISGSNSNLLSGELATFLSGRYVEFEILPFGFNEFAAFHQLEIDKRSYLKYMQSGGLPELFFLPNDETKQHYVSAIKDTVLLRDIIQRYNIKDPNLLEEVFTYLINNSSNLISINNITNYIKSKGRKTTYDTIANYIGYIEETFLVHKVFKYNLKGKEIISGNYKFYANDHAYRNYLYRGFGFGLGYMLENLVYLELKRAGYTIYTGITGNKEVDFAAMKNDQILHIQSSYLLADEKTIEREYRALKAIKDNYRKIVVSLDDIRLPSNEGIEHLQIWNLAENI